MVRRLGRRLVRSSFFRSVERKLWDTEPESVRATCVTSAVLLYSMAVVLLEPAVEAGSLVTVLVSSVSLLGFIWVIEVAVFRWRNLRVGGEWIYCSSSGNFGLVSLRESRSQLHYHVELFRDAESLSTMLDSGRIRSEGHLGHADSTFCTFRDRRVDLRYEINLSSAGYAARAGFLSIVPSGEVFDDMVGYWNSTGASDGASSGRLLFRRGRLIRGGERSAVLGRLRELQVDTTDKVAYEPQPSETPRRALRWLRVLGLTLAGALILTEMLHDGEQIATAPLSADSEGPLT